MNYVKYLTTKMNICVCWAAHTAPIFGLSKKNSWQKSGTYIVFLLCIVSIFACRKKEQNTDIIIEPEMQAYVDEFIAEAKARGYDADFSDTGLKMEWGETDEGSSAFCSDFGDAHSGSHHMVFNKERWDTRHPASNRSRIYHELGHCELDRRHQNVLLSDGTWQTIMRGSPIPDELDHIPRAFYGFREAYYLDELFDPTTPEPDWATMTFSLDDIPTSEKTLLWEVQDTTDFVFTEKIDSDNFEIELKIERSNVKEFIRLDWGNVDTGHYVFIPHFTDNFQVGTKQVFDYQLDRNIDSSIDEQPTNTITIRQHDGYTQVFLNDELEYFFDILPVGLERIKVNSGGFVQVKEFRVFAL